MTVTNRVSLDTNILIYAIDQTDKKRHKTALNVFEKIAQWDCILTLQALKEFFHVATRKKKLSSKNALAQIEDWRIIFPITTAKTSTLIQAIHAAEKYQLAFWDAMLLTTASEAGANLLLSEDFNHHQIIDGVRIVNPFKLLISGNPDPMIKVYLQYLIPQHLLSRLMGLLGNCRWRWWKKL